MSRGRFSVGLVSLLVGLVLGACAKSQPANGYPNDAASKKRVFVTSAAYAGDFGSVATGDMLCTSSSAAASLSGTWKAWLSDDHTDAVVRLDDVGPWYLIDGQTLAFQSLAAVPAGPDQGIHLTERREDVAGASVWTGTTGTGTHSMFNCGGWTIGVGKVDACYLGETSMHPETAGTSGTAQTSANGWTEAITGPDCCDKQSHLYCFEQ